MKNKFYLKIAIFLILVVVIFLAVFTIRDYKYNQRLNFITARESLFSSLHGPKPITVDDVGSIQTWMTFDYINHLFNLPPDYLKNSLSITNSRYPRLTIAKYAVSENTNSNISLLKVQNVIKSFFSQKQ